MATVATSITRAIGVTVFLDDRRIRRSSPRLGRRGHEIIAIVARHCLWPAVPAKVDAMLSSDATNLLTAHDMASEATWADKLREADHDGSRRATREWHFTDIELADGDQGAARFGHPLFRRESPPTPASPTTAPSTRSTNSAGS